jgi:hypothetical protein
VSGPEPAFVEAEFGELFEADRILPREGVTEQEQIKPPLAFATETQVHWKPQAEQEILLAA